jgi:ATP-grasp domain
MAARIATSRLGALLGNTASNPSALDRLLPLLTALQQLILAAGDRIESVDLNPVIVTRNSNVVAVDALIVRRKSQ